MIKLLNKMFYILKFITFFLSLGFTIYIVLGMYTRLQKNYIDSIDIFMPFILILLIFCINIFKSQLVVTENLFYNFTCCLVFFTILFISYRTIFDKNMLLNSIMGYNINFSYFSDFISFLKIMLYGLVIGNFFLIISSINMKNSNNDIEIL